MHMFTQAGPDLPNQIYAELIQARADERLARLIRRQEHADRRAARRMAGRQPPWLSRFAMFVMFNILAALEAAHARRVSPG